LQGLIVLSLSNSGGAAGAQVASRINLPRFLGSFISGEAFFVW
jgi:hypothetical protein